MAKPHRPVIYRATWASRRTCNTLAACWLARQALKGSRCALRGAVAAAAAAAAAGMQPEAADLRRTAASTAQVLHRSSQVSRFQVTGRSIVE